MKKAKKKTKPPLTPLQKKFCDILILMEISGKVNQGKALELAGSKCRGKTATEVASRITRKVQVKKYLAHARALNSRVAEKKQEKTREEIVREYEIMAFARAADYYHADGTAKKIKELTKSQRAALRSIEVVEHHYTNKKGAKGKTVKTSYNIQPKKSSLDSLAKIQGLMKGDVAEAANEFVRAIEETATLLGIIDGKSKGKLPEPTEGKDAG